MYSPSIPFDEYLRGEQIKYPELTYDAIQTLKDSLKDDTNWNQKLSDKKYLAFLHSCNFDQELAKKTARYFYKIYSCTPQVFCDLNPLADEIKQNYKCVSICQMPCTNIDKNIRILYLQFKDTNHEMLDYVSFFKYLFMWLNYTLAMYGTCDEIIAVADSTGLGWRHIVKLPIGITGKMLNFMEMGLPIRLKEIHILNAGSAVQMIMKIVTRLIQGDLLQKIILHSPGSEDIFNYVPRNIMPVEIGGMGKSHHHYNDELYNNMIKNSDLFLEGNVL